MVESERQITASPRPLTIGTAGLALMTAALWGGNAVAVRYSVDVFPPVAVACLRFVLASAFMVVWIRLAGGELRLRTGQARIAIVAGVLLFVQIGSFNLGVQWSNASHGAMLINTFVFWVVLIEHVVTGEDRLSLGKLVGLSAAAAGVALVLSTTGGAAQQAPLPESPTLWGDAVLLASAFVLAIKIVYVKHAIKTVEPSKLILWHNVVGVVCFAAYSAAFESWSWSSFQDTPALLGLAYQGFLVGGLCFAVQAMLLRHHTASQISVFAFATPLFGVAAAIVLRSETASPWLLLSGVLVAAGIYRVTRDNGERPA